MAFRGAETDLGPQGTGLRKLGYIGIDTNFPRRCNQTITGLVDQRCLASILTIKVLDPRRRSAILKYAKDPALL